MSATKLKQSKVDPFETDLEQPLHEEWQDEPTTSKSVLPSSVSAGGGNLAMKVGMSMAGIGGGPIETFTTNQGEDTDAAVEGVGMNLVYLIALSGFGIGAFYMWLYTTLLMDVTSFFLLVLAPTLAIQKRKLIGLGDMRGQQNELRSNCNGLANENKLLCASIKKLEVQVKKLDDIENKLSELAKSSGTNVDHLKYLVEENARVQKATLKALQKDLMQDIVSFVIRSDRDHNFTLEENEKKILLMRLRSMKGIDFDEKNYLKCIAKDEGELTVGDVMAIVRNLMNDSVPEEENIFRIDAKARLT